MPRRFSMSMIRAVVIGAGAVIWFDWLWVDPAITLMLAAYVL